MHPPSDSPATVWCRSASRYAERPIAFLWEGERRRVVQVLAQWRDPNGVGFQVLADDGNAYVLHYNEPSAVWEITPSPPPTSHQATK